MRDSEGEIGCVMLRWRRRTEMESAERQRQRDGDRYWTNSSSKSKQADHRDPHPMKANVGGSQEQMNMEGEQAKNFCM